MTAQELMAFEYEISKLIKQGKINTPTHLCGGNEEQLIEIFRKIKKEDWVFCSYRNHYHALLKNVPREMVLNQILHGRSMTPCYPGYRFFTSAIVGACLPVAVGVAYSIKKSHSTEHVWCFTGDMGATTGVFSEATRFAGGHRLPITFVVEDNGFACDTPTAETWGHGSPDIKRYRYQRLRPHLG